MTQPDLNMEHAQLLLRKALEDEFLIDAVIGNEHVSDEIIGFHCQQAAEKLIKALLASMGIVYRRTHDLNELVNILSANNLELPANIIDIDLLTPFAVEYRYQEWTDGDEQFERGEARQIIVDLRTWVENKINLPLKGE